MTVLEILSTFLSLSLVIALPTNWTPFPYDPGFDIQKVVQLAEALPSHSWEYGTASEALLELYNPEYSVFGQSPFPVPTLDKDSVPSLAYAATKFEIGTGANALINGDGAVGDPAGLGVSAVLLGKTNLTLAKAVEDELEYVLYGAPRFLNGAISQRADVAELWADFMYMAPPLIAYYGAATDNATLLLEATEQSGLYRQVLRDNTTAPYQGVWEHIIGPQSQDTGFWSTGNGWAAAGMTRVLATVMKAPVAFSADWRGSVVDELTDFIAEIVNGAIQSPADNGLLRNYLNDTTSPHGFGETSGTSLLASVAYRMAVLRPDIFGWNQIAWADKVRQVLGGTDQDGDPHVTQNGTVTPAVNPLNWQDTTPYTAGSPEGQNFVALLYAAWRDCINAGVCQNPSTEGPEPSSLSS